MDCSSKIKLPNELKAELANAFCFDFRWSVLRVSSSVFDHFLAKRQHKILQNVDLKFRQSCEQHVELDNVGQKLANLGNEISLPMSNVPIHEAVIAARILISLHTRNFNELYAFLESHKFPRQMHPKLQKIWWDIHFLEAQQTLGKSQLSLLEKYKVREKYPLPPTIWDGQRKNGLFSENTLTLLNEQYAESRYFYAGRWEIAEATGLSETQGFLKENDFSAENQSHTTPTTVEFSKFRSDPKQEKHRKGLKSIEEARRTGETTPALVAAAHEAAHSIVVLLNEDIAESFISTTIIGQNGLDGLTMSTRRPNEDCRQRN
ncbi:hypothetical protein niasHT_029573 [Heterodera trifolii]|uniref:Homeobox protein SIX1 N-terminal SD domain-containing protein n=1 Tax=Heterodera trifolii TaxID=157864 RepID=A0ABD2JB23_9BILA